MTDCPTIASPSPADAGCKALSPCSEQLTEGGHSCELGSNGQSREGGAAQWAGLEGQYSGRG